MIKLFLFFLLLGSAGQILLKMAANDITTQGLMPTIAALIKDYRVLLMIFLYSIGFFVWGYLLTKHELSYVFPLLSLVYIVVLLASWLIFKESITPMRIAGTLIIVLGVFLIVK